METLTKHLIFDIKRTLLRYPSDGHKENRFVIKSRLAIHIFGRNVGTEGWVENQLWDTETKRLGAVGMALFIASRRETQAAVMLTFGTGASEKGGLKESEYTRQYALDHLRELCAFPEFGGVDYNLLCTWLEGAFCETTSKNTVEEIQKIGEYYRANDVTEVIGVTCPNHAPRCFREMWVGWYQTFDAGTRSPPWIFSIMAGDIPFTGYHPRTTAILEAPHIPGDSTPPFWELVPQFFRHKNKQELYEAIKALLE